MSFINKRTKKLTPKEVNDFFEDHLVYRLKMLMTAGPKFNKKDALWTCTYESMQISCRMFLEFLGLKAKRNRNSPKLVNNTKYFSEDGQTSHEVKVVDLGGNFVKINEDLSEAEREILAHAYESGNKATAHLTHGTDFRPDPHKVFQARDLIRKLIKSNLEDIVGKEIKTANI